MGALHDLSIHEAAGLLRDKKASAVELTGAVLARLDAVESTVSAYLHVMRDSALRQAAESDARRAKGAALGPLDGIPLALKDNLCTQGIPTTCASKVLQGFLPPYDATVVERLRAAGAVFTGKTNLDEFAMGSSTENSAYHTSKNPWNPACVPGGSSGGSAAAVAAGEALGALGSDTGGSIRQPAALTGLTGLKPTYGRVSRYGLVAFASSLDQIGPLARDAEDAALIQDVIEGFDPKDSTSVKMEWERSTAALAKPVTGMTIGLAEEWYGPGLDADVRKHVEAVRPVLEKMGVTFKTVHLPRQEFGLPVYYLIAPAEASSNLARYDGVRYGKRAMNSPNIIEMYKATRSAGFGAEVKRRIILGTYVLSAGYYDAYYLKALKARTRIREDYATALTGCDALLSPATPTPAFRIGEKSADPLQMYLSDIYTVGANLAGVPALAFPCGFAASGLPVGAHLIGKPWQDATLLRIAHAFQRETGHHLKRAAGV